MVINQKQNTNSGDNIANLRIFYINLTRILNVYQAK